MAYSQVRSTPPLSAAATPLFVPGPFVRLVPRLPCLLLISQGFCLLFFRYSLRFSSPDGHSRGRLSEAWKMAVDVSAGLVTIRLRFILHGNGNRGSTLRPQAVLNTRAGGGERWE